MKQNTKSLIAGIAYFIEGNGLEIKRGFIRTYSHNDDSAAEEAISHLVEQGEAYLVKPLNEAKDGDTCIVMLGYPGGTSPYAAWNRWFNSVLLQTTCLPHAVIQKNLKEETTEPNHPVQPTSLRSAADR